MKSLAGVAAKINPLCVTRSPGPVTPISAVLPALAIDPIAFSTTLARPPCLLPGVGFAARSAPPCRRYSSYHAISRTNSRAISGVAARAVSKCAASRTSVTSENITVAPARTSRSAANPTAGFAVTPESASDPPHCKPTTRSEAGHVVRRRSFSRASFFSARAMIVATISPKPFCAS